MKIWSWSSFDRLCLLCVSGVCVNVVKYRQSSAENSLGESHCPFYVLLTLALTMPYSKWFATILLADLMAQLYQEGLKFQKSFRNFSLISLKTLHD